MPINLDIEHKAEQLLGQNGIDFLPVPVEEVAKKSGINVFPFDLGSEVSGVLHINNNGADIGYNPSESRVRQRFTLAHEIGHFILHYAKSKVFVDNEKYFQFVMFRSGKSNMADADYKYEQEANSFAAALLMPKLILQKELQIYNGFDLSDGGMVTELAKRFEVSLQAMSFRIINLSEAGLL